MFLMFGITVCNLDTKFPNNKEFITITKITNKYLSVLLNNINFICDFLIIILYKNKYYNLKLKKNLN